MGVDQTTRAAAERCTVPLHDADLLDAGHGLEDLGRGLDPLGYADVHDMPDLGSTQDLVHRAIEEQLTLFDDAHGVAQLGQLMEDVRRDQDGLAHPLELLEQLADLDAGARVEARCGLVHQQHLRIVQQHASDAQALLHAAAE